MDAKTERLQLVMTPRQKEMLKQVAQKQRRSMNDVIRLAIEGLYQRQMMQGSAGQSGAQARSSGDTRDR